MLLLMVLYWLRHYPRYSTLGTVFNVSTNTASRVISWLLPAFYTRIRYISWPKEFQISSFEGVVGSIDGTCHFRNRIHPRSGDLYRGDKHAHFIGAQVVCGLDGKFFSVMLTLGHNND